MLSFREHRYVSFLIEMPHLTINNKSVDFEAEKAKIHKDLESFIEDKTLEQLEEKREIIQQNAWKEVKAVLTKINNKLTNNQVTAESISNKIPLVIGEDQFSENNYVNPIYLNHLEQLFSDHKIENSNYPDTDRLYKFNTQTITQEIRQQALNLLMKESNDPKSFYQRFKSDFFNKIKILKEED